MTWRVRWWGAVATACELLHVYEWADEAFWRAWRADWRAKGLPWPD